MTGALRFFAARSLRGGQPVPGEEGAPVLRPRLPGRYEPIAPPEPELAVVAIEAEREAAAKPAALQSRPTIPPPTPVQDRQPRPDRDPVQPRPRLEQRDEPKSEAVIRPAAPPSPGAMQDARPAPVPAPPLPPEAGPVRGPPPPPEAPPRSVPVMPAARAPEAPAVLREASRVAAAVAGPVDAVRAREPEAQAPVQARRAELPASVSPPGRIVPTRRAASAPEAGPLVQVTIGRIEIRAAAPPPPAAKRAAKPAPLMSLDDYLTLRGKP